MLHRPASRSTVACNLATNLVPEDGPRQPLHAALRFDPADPIAVALSIDVGTEAPVTWSFARQLLADGSRRPVGQGDVRVRPTLDRGRPLLALSLQSPSGHAELELPAAKVLAFVRRTYHQVPAEAEDQAIDWETELGLLFGLGTPIPEER